MGGTDRSGARAEYGSRARVAATRLAGVRAIKRWVAVAFVSIGALLLWSAPALALSQRGHVLSFSFGTGGSGEGQFFEPGGVAVNESTGDVYVADRGNNRVERFSCALSESPPKCKFVALFKVPLPGAIAIDNSASPSAGDVYVVSGEEKKVIYKYDPSTEKVTLHLKGAAPGSGGPEEFAEIKGIAVDSSGHLWIYEEEEGVIDAFTAATANKFFSKVELHVPEKLGCNTKPGFAVGPKGEFFISHEAINGAEECQEEKSAVAELNSQGQTLVKELDTPSTVETERPEGNPVAADISNGDVYVSETTSVAALSPNDALVQRLGLPGGAPHGSGVAVDSQHAAVYVADSHENRIDVYQAEPPGPPQIDSVSSEGITASATEVNAQIDPHGAETHYVVQYGTVACAENESSCTNVPAPPGSIGTSIEGAPENFGDQSVAVKLLHLQPGTTYNYRVLATNTTKASGTVTTASAESSFRTALAALPTPVGLLPDHRAWELVSPINKHGAGLDVIGSPHSALVQASEDGSLITYGANGPIEGEPQGNQSPQATQVFSSRGATEWSSKEINTPSFKAEAGTETHAPEYQFFSSDLSLGLLLPLEPSDPVEEPQLTNEAGGQRTIYRRHNSTCQATPATCFEAVVKTSNVPEKTAFGGKLEILGASPDLSHVVLESKVALTSTAQSGEFGLYEWAAPPAEQLQFVSLLPNGTPATHPVLGDGSVSVRNAISSDGSRVVWTEAEGGEVKVGEVEEANEALYMYDARTKKTVRVNAAQSVPEPNLNTEAGAELVHFQIASSDGSRIFFTDTWPLTTESHLKPVPGATGREKNPSDLYEYNVNTGKLTDLTVGSKERPADVLNAVLGASEDGSYIYFVANGALASGAPSAQGTCAEQREQTEATCNLYVSEPDPVHPGKNTTKFIAAISAEDAPDWAAPGEHESFAHVGLLTSRVSPKGRYLAFMSDRSLTGYDNLDANSGKADEEVYLYDASTGHLACASCKPSGERPVGVLDTPNAGEGAGLLVDRANIWPGRFGSRWLAASIPGWTPLEEAEAEGSRAPHQSRYLSDSGRLFFNSADALVPEVTTPTREEEIEPGQTRKVGVENVYEYEPGGVPAGEPGECKSESGCVALLSKGTSQRESAFLDASVSGNDAFFLTAEKLVKQDEDTTFDVYDARLCTNASPCLESPPTAPPPCASTGSCRPGSPPPSPNAGPSGSATFSGPGNPKQATLPFVETKPETNAQKLAKALKACRQKYKAKTKQAKKKRAACESQAKRKYAPKKSNRHHKGTK
jgi:DNA-binding beta-propeller fold protein YncE